MNNIYKVIWSKAKNCYVVASEIAKSHTKSASGSEKMGGYGKKALLALAAASAIFCGGLVNVGATVRVNGVTDGANEVYTTTEVNTELGKKANADSVYTKGETYTKDEVNTELGKKADANNVYTKTEANGTFATSGALNTAKTDLEGEITTAKNELDGKIAANTTKITANEKAINDLNTKAATTETTLTDLSGRMAAAESDIDGLQADMATAKSDINSLKTKDTELSGKIDAEINNRITSDTALDKKIDAEINNRITSDTALDKKIDAEINNRITSDTALDKKIDKEIANRITSDTALDKKIDKEIQDRKDAIGTIAENKNYIEKDKNVSDNLVELDKQAKANADAITKTNQRTAGITRDDTRKETSIEGKVTVDTNGNIKAEGTITSNGLDARAGEIKTTGKVSAGDVSTGTLETTGNAKIGGDLTVKGKLDVDKISMKNDGLDPNGDQHHSATTITADGISNNVKVTDKNGVTTESKFTHDKEGSTTYAYHGDAADWKESTSNVTADGVKNVAKDSKGNNNTFTQTSTDTKNTLTDQEGNTSTTRQDSKGIYGYAKDKDGNKSYTKQEGNRIAESVIGQDGKQTKSEMTSTDITNTAKDGTITNTAKKVTNEGTESVTNKVGANEVKVSQDGVDIKAEDGKKITESVGTASRVVENDKITDNAGNSTVTTENGKGTTFGKEGSTGTTNIYGDSIKTGTINAEDTTTDKLTAGAAAGADGGRLTVDANDGVKGSYKSGGYTSRSYILANTLKSGVDNDKDPTEDGFVGSRTDHYMVGDKAKLDETVKDDAGSNVTNKTSTDTVTTITDGTTTTKTEQGTKDITNTATAGTITNDAKVITNKASEVINNEAININNTATGTITSKASEIKNEADKLISNKVGENTWENMEDGRITTSIKNGTKQNLTQSDAEKTEHSVVNGSNSTVNKQTSEEITDAVTNGTTTNVTQNTATSSNNTIADTNGNANTVVSTVDGTKFTNTGANTAIREGTVTDTTITGNTITTGQVKMDYAQVMRDLGVNGNANIGGKTTTGSLEVKGESKLTGNVTMENNATVGNDLTVKGITTTKTLKVTENAEINGNATIKGDVTAKSYKVGDKTYINADGINANNQKITNVADGSISEGSKDAVNGGQLYNVKNDLEGKVNKVGANAAAMANLHPMEFDPDSKWNIAAAIGNYGSETAAALGAFYRPNDDVMVNLSTAFGTGENMVGGGVSVRLGKGGNKLSREESNALKAQVADLTARMDALLSVLNPNMSKDFPDVPENHWAYEAVSRLAGNDIVQGYPDGEFHGERTMTRYEMAEIIYNALSRGAEAEKELVEEFKPELQAMAASEKATAERAEG